MIVALLVELLIWMGVWILRRYNHDLKTREELYGEVEQKLP